MAMMALSVCEALCALSILDRLRPNRSDWFDTVDGFLAFVGAAVFASAVFAIPATVIAAPVVLETFLESWVGWSAAVSVGTLTVTPIAWLVYSGRFRQDWATGSSESRIGTIFIFSGVGLVTLGTFAQSVWPLMFLPFFPLVVTAFKSDRIGAVLGILIFSDIALIATQMGHGPIAAMLGASPARYLVLQIYLGTAFMIVFPAALELRERTLITESLQAALEKLSASERHAHDLAYTDPLTGLSNRRSLLDALDKACRTPSNITVAIIDLNQFKAINDRWGHLVGDEILRAVSERFAQAIGSDALIARLGGDEFAILCEGASACDPAGLGSKVVRALHEPILIGRREFPVRCACGLVVSSAGEARTSSSLLGRADVAMYSAKGNPDNPVAVFCSAMREGEERKTEIANALLTHDGRSDIHLVYQPVFDLHSGQIVSLEALARWRHPDLGPISPAEFIPIAERARVIEPLTWRLLELAIGNAAEWDPGIALSFNFSAPHLGSEGVVESILQNLDRGGLEPARLKLEITETALLTNTESTAANCERLQRAGIRIVLDDFGAGFASLSYLRALRFDEIKMDSSLTLGARHKDGYLLAKGVLDLCRAIDVPCTAEHLETADDVERLSALGCRYGQGYWLHRPVSAEDARALAANQDNLIRLVRRPG